MSNFAVVNMDEHWVESPFFDTEQEAIDFITNATGMAWDELESDDYYVRSHSDEERKRIEEDIYTVLKTKNDFQIAQWFEKNVKEEE